MSMGFFNPFSSSNDNNLKQILNSLIDDNEELQEKLQLHIDNNDVHISKDEKDKWDNNVTASIDESIECLIFSNEINNGDDNNG